MGHRLQNHVGCVAESLLVVSSVGHRPKFIAAAVVVEANLYCDFGCPKLLEPLVADGNRFPYWEVDQGLGRDQDQDQDQDQKLDSRTHLQMLYQSVQTQEPLAPIPQEATTQGEP